MLDIMRPHRGGMRIAHVKFVGPDESEENGRLTAVCELTNTSFIQACLDEDEHRPLKLHCMLLNTVYRRQCARKKAGSVCLRAILASDAFKQISDTRPSADAAGPGASPIAKIVSATASPSLSTGVNIDECQRPNPRATQNEHGHRIDLGAYNVNEVQICRMGSSGPEGEYVSVGGVRLDGGGGGGGELI